MTTGNEVLFEIVDGHIAVVTLNRPEVRNAVNGAVAQALDAFVKRIEADAEIRVAILTSSQDKVFCAGADLSEIAAGRAHTLSTPDGGFAGFVENKREKPWIAAVEGTAFAGGCELTLACDMIVISQNAKFGLPEVKRGLFAGAAGVYRLPRRLPRNIALELVATGDALEADRAYAMGLANRMTASGGVMKAAIDLARAIAANAPMSVRESLAVARLAQDLSEDELRPLSRAASGRVFSSEDAKEGPRAFLEKRAPVWKGY
ncbi:MAG: enoyl-CoA hydratase-related protein [Hyphomonadaceae bacterium]